MLQSTLEILAEPLVDINGAVIGVNSAIASLGSSFSSQSGSIGLGFAIPINQAKKTAEQLIKTGKATYPLMGISVDSTYAGSGARIADIPNAILPGGPAAKAGLRPGDIILEIDGQSVANGDALIVAIRSHNVGDRITVKFKRGAPQRVFP
jgi:putative serine protease PepD